MYQNEQLYKDWVKKCLIGNIDKLYEEKHRAEHEKKKRHIKEENQRWNRSGFLITGTGTGPKRTDRTGPAGLKIFPIPILSLDSDN